MDEVIQDLDQVYTGHIKIEKTVNGPWDEDVVSKISMEAMLKNLRAKLRARGFTTKVLFQIEKSATELTITDNKSSEEAKAQEEARTLRGQIQARVLVKKIERAQLKSIVELQHQRIGKAKKNDLIEFMFNEFGVTLDPKKKAVDLKDQAKKTVRKQIMSPQG